MKATQRVISALEKHRKLIEGAIQYRAPNNRKQRAAVRAFCKNNAEDLGLSGINLSCQVDWCEVIEAFGAAKEAAE